MTHEAPEGAARKAAEMIAQLPVVKGPMCSNASHEGCEELIAVACNVHG